MAIITGQSLNFEVLSQKILQDISLTLEDGDRLIILGASGSGKSSLLYLLNRLQSPTSGKLQFNKKPYDVYSPEQLRQQITLVPQDPKLLGMVVKEALFYPLKLQQLTKVELQRRWLFWQERFDIPDIWLDRNEALLSGGQKQWVAIARALMMEPQILLLDEPTSALDIGRSQKLAQVLIDYQTEKPLPMAIATHSFDFAQQFATKVIYLEKGRIQIQGDRHQIDWAEIQAKLIAQSNNASTEDHW
ncbi:MAG: ATP-binding cassette domain-containing protein [Limnothrix sp. RL_2_0]|nr:ATP-binding cassette domain-containing protein [Limnothrix sp. RL_2_0]